MGEAARVGDLFVFQIKMHPPGQQVLMLLGWAKSIGHILVAPLGKFPGLAAAGGEQPAL